MSFAQDVYEDVKAAYVAVLAGLADGAPVVEYMIRGRKVVHAPSEKLLDSLYKQATDLEQRINSQGTSIFRLVRLTGVSARGNS